MEKMPAWADVVLVPLISLLLAAAISALVIMAIGEDPVAAVKMMVSGALDFAGVTTPKKCPFFDAIFFYASSLGARQKPPCHSGREEA